MLGKGGWSDPTAKVYVEVYAAREHEAWDLRSLLMASTLYFYFKMTPHSKLQVDVED
jgi:hypothetical protein